VTLHAADAAEVTRGLGTTRAAGVLTAALGPLIVAGTVSAAGPRRHSDWSAARPTSARSSKRSAPD
jgi:hypothetical protein